MLHTDTNSLATKKSVLSHHPCFSSLTDVELTQLASLLVEKNFHPGKSIVKENHLVDSIYFIINGTAEVRHNAILNNKKENVPLATLSKGETIGLNELGFYSADGKRTATVKAITHVNTFMLTIEAFSQFASTHPQINEILRSKSELLMRMNLIKHAAPFAKLSIKNLQRLAERVQSITVEAGQLLFQKNDAAETCYLVETGAIKIFLPQKNNKETQLAVLKESTIFGEAGLLMEAPRNASARALENCKLLVLEKKDLLDVIKTEKNTALSLTQLIRSRSRPKQLAHIEQYEQQTADHEDIITLKNAELGSYFRLSKEGFLIWHLLDGKHTIRDIALVFHKKYHVFDPDMIADFIIELEDAGFIEKKSMPAEKEPAKNTWLSQSIFTIRKIMEASISFGQADVWLTQTYQKYVRYFYSIPAQISLCLFVMFSVSIFIHDFHHHVDTLHHSKHFSWLLMLAISTSMATILLHELAHAYTTKAFGRKVKTFGVGWFWLGPMAYCDTSDMWLSSKWPRIAVDLSGIYMDLISAGIMGLLAYFITNPVISLFFWLVALFNYLSIITNLTPSIELDGYYTLMDLFGKENLRESAIHWLTTYFFACLKRPRLFLRHKAEVAYWCICIIYLIPQIFVPYVVMNVLLYGLLGVKNPYLALAFPLIALVISSLSILEKVRQQKIL